MTPIRITLELTPTGRYRAMLGAKLLVTSREPVRSAARVLLAEGMDPDTVLEARQWGTLALVQRATLRDTAGRLPGRESPVERDSDASRHSETPEP